jgi:signal transduction histidine kinase/CheY-like chemotaxis protein
LTPILVALSVGLAVTLLLLVRRRSRHYLDLKYEIESARQALREANARTDEAQRATNEARLTQQLLEEQLRQSQKMEAMGQLAGGIAHDFNNLLTVIRGHSELLSSAIDSADPRHEGISQIHEASRRASVLTRQLLAFTRKQELQPRQIAIDQHVSNLAPMLRRLIGEDIDIQLYLADHTSHVMTDPGQLDQVLINLAVNARDAMPSGGTLSITTANVDIGDHYTIQHEATVQGTYVLISVSDTGSGMDAHTMAHIFEPFFTTKPPGRGCGLGLSTVYGIIKQSGGYIWAYSEIGHGSTFKIYLPQAVDVTDIPGPTFISSEHALGRDCGGTETILLVEDDNALRSLTRQILARNGYTVLDAANGREASHLASHQEGRIDLVITDMVMPELGGPALVTQLLLNRPQLRALFMSGYTDDDIIRRGMLEPNADFLQKPFTANGILHAVRNVLDQQPHATATRS